MNQANAIKNQSQYLKAVKQLQAWDQAYFQKQISLVSDQVYDALYAQVVAFEKRHPDLVVANSPTQVVNDDKISQTNKVNHLHPVLSLEKAHDMSDVNKFINQFAIDETFIVQPKVDGATLVLKYDKQGQLVQLSSRGNGQIGNDLSHLQSAIMGVVTKINVNDLPFLSAKNYLIRGEVYLNKADFQALQAQDPTLKNARNTAAGALNLKDVSVAKTRWLRFVAYDFKAVSANQDIMHFENQGALNTYLINQGFNVLEAAEINRDAIENALNIINQNRDHLPYEIDGAVIKPYHLKYLNQLGYTNKYPRAMLAFKYPSQRMVTAIRALTIDVAKTGKLTYTVTIDPVDLAGKTIKTINVHNQEQIRKANLAIGDQVTIYLAGEIIPQIDQVVNHNDDPELALVNHLWTNCAYCQHDIIDDYCQNPSCDEIQIKLLIDQAKALDLKGLGQAHIRTCYQAQTITNLYDLLSLDESKLRPIKSNQHQSSKTITNILNQADKPLNFYQFLLALQIENVADAKIKALVKKYQNWDNLINHLHDFQASKLKQDQNIYHKLINLDPRLIKIYHERAGAQNKKKLVSKTKLHRI